MGYWGKCYRLPEDHLLDQFLLLGLPGSSPNPPLHTSVGIPEFLNSVGGGVETHVAKLESEIGELHDMLVTRTLRLKKLDIPCKHLRNACWESLIDTRSREYMAGENFASLEPM